MTRHAAAPLIVFVAAASALGVACRRNSKNAPPPIPLLETVEIVDVSEKSELLSNSGEKYDTGALANIVRGALTKAELVAAPVTGTDAAAATPRPPRAVARVR